MATPTTTWMKLTFRLGLDGNPLRRRSDRIEAWLAPAAVALFLAASPVAGVVAGAWVHAESAAAHNASLSWQRLRGVLLEAAPGPAFSDHGSNAWLEPTLARWTVDGREHVGDVPAAAGSSAGSAVTVLVNRAGQVQLPPPTAGQVRGRVISATAIALGAIAVVLAAAAWLARLVLNRRRLAGWETAWLAVGPRWSRQA